MWQIEILKLPVVSMTGSVAESIIVLGNLQLSWGNSWLEIAFDTL